MSEGFPQIAVASLSESRSFSASQGQESKRVELTRSTRLHGNA